MSSIVFFLSWHSQITWTVQPSSSNAARLRSSRSTLRSNFTTQYSTLLFGMLGLQCGHLCQKHPLTNSATFLPGHATSGCPGTFHCSRYPVRPAARRRSRTRSSGFVLLRLLPFMDLRTASFEAGGASNLAGAGNAGRERRTTSAGNGRFSRLRNAVSQLLLLSLFRIMRRMIPRISPGELFSYLNKYKNIDLTSSLFSGGFPG